MAFHLEIGQLPPRVAPRRKPNIGPGSPRESSVPDCVLYVILNSGKLRRVPILRGGSNTIAGGTIAFLDM